MTITKDLVIETENKLQSMIKTNRIQIAKGFSAENALREAQLILEGDPKLKACDTISIQHAMLKMIVLGLSPMKQQIYFIPRGKQLCADISYFGSMALVKRFCGATEIVNMVIYEDDEFEYEIRGGKFQLPRHKSEFKNRTKDKLIGAYTVIFFPKSFYVDIMTKDEILRSWSKSKTYGDSSAHNIFSEEMFKRTVCNRACKPWLKSSADYIAVEHTQIKEGIETEIDHYANQIELDMGDYKPEEADQPEPKQKKAQPPIQEEPPKNETKRNMAKRAIDFNKRTPDDPDDSLPFYDDPDDPLPFYGEPDLSREPAPRVANVPDF